MRDPGGKPLPGWARVKKAGDTAVSSPDDMAAETNRMTDKTDAILKEIAESDLSRLVDAVHGVNETLAVHAAWTYEQFNNVDFRLVQVARLHTQVLTKLEEVLVRLRIMQDAYNAFMAGPGPGTGTGTASAPQAGETGGGADYLRNQRHEAATTRNEAA